MASALVPPDYFQIPPSQIAAIDRLMDVEPLMHTVTDIALSGVLSGGILFDRSGHKLDDTSAAYYQQTWVQFAREMQLSLWRYGFAAVAFEPHERYKATPRLLNLAMVSIYVRRNLMNRNDYIFTRLAGAGMGPGMLAAQEVVRNIMVIELDPPDGRGCLRSKCVHVWREREFIVHVMRAESLAISAMANPALLVEHADQDRRPNPLSVVPENDNRLGAPEDTRGASAGNGMQPVGGFTALSTPTDMYSDLDASEHIFHTHRLSQFDEQADPLGLRRAHFAAFAPGAPLRPRLQPQHGQIYHLPHAPTEPQHITQLLLNYQEVISGLFGVPRGFYAQFSAGRTTSSPDARMMWNNAQRTLRRSLTASLQVVFDHIYSEDMALDAVTRADSAHDSKLHAQSMVTLSILGVPDPMTLRELWLDGALSYNAYCEIIGCVHGLASDQFNDTVMPVAGLAESTPSAASQQQPSSMSN